MTPTWEICQIPGKLSWYVFLNQGSETAATIFAQGKRGRLKAFKSHQGAQREADRLNNG